MKHLVNGLRQAAKRHYPVRFGTAELFNVAANRIEQLEDVLRGVLAAQLGPDAIRQALDGTDASG